MDDLIKIEHVVILMQENRSFDHYYGTLKGVRGFGDQSVILLPGTRSGSSGKTVFEQPDSSSWRYPWMLNRGSADGWKNAQGVGTAHSWVDGHGAWNNGLLDAWIANKGLLTMGYFTRDDLPFHYDLADNFTICDNYYCSVLSSTGPNRNYFWSGSTGVGIISPPHVNGGDFVGTNQSWRVYVKELQAAGVTWRTYNVENDNYENNALEYFKDFDSGALYDLGVKSVPDVPGGSTADRIIEAIRKDVLDGTLPQVSWVVTDEAHCEHSDETPSRGAVFVKRLLDSLSADEDTLRRVALFITYDENDGFFDHVPPPFPSKGSPDATDEWATYEGAEGPIGLGIRVPMIVVSPWTTGGRVCSQVFDHTSMLMFLEKWTAALGKPAVCQNITSWRRKVCGDLTSVFDFSKDASTYTLPTLGPAAPAGEVPGATGTNPTPPSTNAEPVQESGTKPACALPYQTNAYLDRTEVSDGSTSIWIRMLNLGEYATSAAHFATYANAYRSGGPWQYTIGADSEQEDFFNVGSGKYDFTVIGPNRFLRRFTGDASKISQGKHVSVKCTFEMHSSTGKLAVFFNMKNHGTQRVVFRIKSNQYRTWDKTYSVAAASQETEFFNAVAYNAGWYDFTIAVDNDSTWTERFAGHIEYGQSSTTG
ncbi:phosphocholine-specific phospholipase C [Streptomyces albireticuli]|uniref:phosphocholine-specific phospholipase C n=1 Tax=Streptomyces albireticuli TaxID=1940 RepID=UPI00147652F1|nr:phospholipase C, phosphocholine-specific [Streptomyces albireticuli]MCD9145863.1 phospholipase C, phosphocholine-specific [Streptomyces albireticuli]MCD9166150.1 phospholipase C, phosphocholine-specific [Streptomyces albireticuli]MCD9189652.1 phospholipase C, phosphocholine-specific [Streptomyces albireticuli]